MWVVRVGGDDGELRPRHYIYVYSIESRLIMRVKYDSDIRIQFSLDWFGVTATRDEVASTDGAVPRWARSWRLIHSCITQLKAQGPSRTCNESNEEEEEGTTTQDAVASTDPVLGVGGWGSNSHGARPVHQIISVIKWIRTSRLSIKNSLSGYRDAGRGGVDRPGGEGEG